MFHSTQQKAVESDLLAVIGAAGRVPRCKAGPPVFCRPLHDFEEIIRTKASASPGLRERLKRSHYHPLQDASPFGWPHGDQAPGEITGDLGL